MPATAPVRVVDAPCIGGETARMLRGALPPPSGGDVTDAVLWLGANGGAEGGAPDAAVASKLDFLVRLLDTLGGAPIGGNLEDNVANGRPKTAQKTTPLRPAVHSRADAITRGAAASMDQAPLSEHLRRIRDDRRW